VPVVRPHAVAPQSGRIRALVTARNITIIIVAFIAIFVLRLLISVATDANAYAIAEKAQLSQNLTRDAQFLQEQLNVLNSPQNLSAVATQLGMISNSNPAYLRISDGKMWGSPQVVAPELDDRATIANVLLSTLLPVPAEQGVATDSSRSGGAESGENSGAGTGSGASAIPAPNTN
jgi:DNA-binding phage protein